MEAIHILAFMSTFAARHASSHVSPIEGSIKRQSRSIFVVVHAREIVFGIDVPCTAKEEFFERLERTGTQRINDSAESDLYRKPLRSGDGDQLEVVWESPGPIGNEVILRESHVCI